MNSTTMMIWLKEQAAKTAAELIETKERVEILRIQSKVYEDIIDAFEGKNNSPADTLASSQDYHSNN